MTCILIVDDHPLYRYGVAAMLQAHFVDAQILQAGSARDAIAIATTTDNIDWFLLDYFLPDCNGIGLLKQLRKLNDQARYVLTSGNDRVELVAEALEHGVHGFLSKAGAPTEVVDCLARIGAGQIYLTMDMQLQLRHYRTTVQESKKRISLMISKRQMEVLLLLSEGYSNSEIASALGISPHTVKDHVSNIMQLLEADNRVHCITEARQLGLLN